MSQPKNIPGWTYKYFLGSHFWKCDINEDLQVIARDDCIDFDQKPGGLEITYILDKTIRPERCGWYVSFSDKGKGATSYPRAGTPTNGDFEWTRGPFTEEEALHWAEMLLLDWNFRKRNVYPKDYSMDIPGWVHETQYLSDLWRNRINMTYSFILKPVGGHRYEVWKYIQHPSKEEWLSKDRLEAMILGKKAGVGRVKWYSEHTYVPKDPLHVQLDKYLEAMEGLSDAQIKDMLKLMEGGMNPNEAYKKVLGYPTDNPGHNPGHHAGNPGKFKYPISIAPSPGTYLMGHYADGSLDLMRVISEPIIHPARTLKTTIDIPIPEHWDLEVEIPNSPPDSGGHIYLTPPVVADTKLANDEDFEAFIIEQKQNLMDVRKDYGPDPQKMADWFRRGIEVAYEWWKEFREKRGIDPPPPLSQVAPKGQRTLFNNLVQQPPAVVQSNGGEAEWKWQKAAKGPDVGKWKEKYDNLLPQVKKVIDKIIISKPFLDAIEFDRKPGEILDSYAFHWGTALSNADEYRGSWRAPEEGKRILSDEEIRLVSRTSSRPWLTFNRPYWEEFAKKVVPGYRQIKEYRKIYTPNELRDIVARGDYNYMHDPEQLEPGYMEEWQLDPHTFFMASRLLPESERGVNRDLEHFVNSDIKDGTAVAAVLDENGNLWYFRRYQEHHGWLVTVDMPDYWKKREKEERGSVETDTLNEYLGVQEKPWEEKGYETEADMLADQEEWDKLVQEGGAAHAVRIRQGFHRQAQRIPYSNVVSMEMDWRKRGYDVVKEPVEKQGDLWDLYVKAKKPEKKKTGTLDDYLYGGEGR